MQETFKTIACWNRRIETPVNSRASQRIWLLIFPLLASAMLWAAGCARAVKANTQQKPTPVEVAAVSCRDLDESDEFTGRLEAVNTVELRPRVSGYLETVNFKEGAIVRKGDLLFRIDPRPFQAEVDRLKGELGQASAQLARAQSDFERAERLHNNNGMSAEEYDRRAALRGEAKARLSSIEGELRGAELNLEFTRIVAPISGRIGRAEITEGNLVANGPAQLKPLATLVSLDPIYVYFDADEQSHLKYSNHGKAKKKIDSSELNSKVSLGLANEEGFPHLGRLDFVDNQVSASTGTIRLRGTFSNEDLTLTPGLFARVKLQGKDIYRGCLIRDESVGTDLNQKFALAIGQSNKLEYRPLKLGGVIDGLRVVREGLQPGDQIVVNGLQRVRAGSTVEPKPVSMIKRDDHATVAQQR